MNKALVGPCGFIDVEAVVSVPLRLLRINSASSPKQVRADKNIFNELMQIHLESLHCLAWKIISFVFKNAEMGTDIFEKELAALVRDQIKIELNAEKKFGKGSEKAINEFTRLIRISSSFNGQVFVREVINSGILAEVCSKYSRNMISILRDGLNTGDSNTVSSNKRVRYHQVNESDQKRLEAAQKLFSDSLDESFRLFSRTLVIFEASQGHLSAQEHVTMVDSLLSVICALLKSQHNYKFIPEIIEREYLRILIDFLSFGLTSFQPAYLPPYLPLAMRILNLLASQIDGAGLSSRRTLLQVDLMIHPRRLGPLTYRPASESILKVFELSETVLTEQLNELKSSKIQESEFQASSSSNLNAESSDSVIAEIPTMGTKLTHEIKSAEREKVGDILEISTPSKPVENLKKSSVQLQQSEDDDDDFPLPQIVESFPDDC